MTSALTPDGTPQTRIEVAGSGEVLMATRSEPEWFTSVLERLREVGDLESNWDSYGAATVDAVSVHLAHCFLSHLKAYVGVDRPQVTATPDGRVAFSWENETSSLDVELDPKGMASFCFENADGQEEDGETPDFLFLIEKLTRIQ